jgi:hypothetical protein
MLRKRWYIAVPALMLAIIFTLVTYASIPTRYGSTGIMLLTSPSAGGRVTEKTNPAEVTQINPLLAFDGSLVTSAQIAATVLNDPATKEQLGIGPNSTDTYLANNGTTNSPFLFVIAQSDSAEGSQQLVGKALERARQDLDARQTELQAPQSTFIQLQVLVKPTTPEPQIGGKLRFAGAALVLSLILALTATFAGDSLINALRRRRDRGFLPGAHAAAPKQPTPPDPSRPRPSPRPLANASDDLTRPAMTPVPPSRKGVEQPRNGNPGVPVYSVRTRDHGAAAEPPE